MSILMFDPIDRNYLPVEKVLSAGVKPLSPSNATHKVGEGNQTVINQQQEIKQKLQQTYQQNTNNQHVIEPAIAIEQIMSSPVISLPSDTNIEAARSLFRQYRFRHIPITSETDSIIGIISDRDVLQHINDPANTGIEHLITERVLVASPDTEIREVAKILFEQRIGAMPVINDTEKLIGIITRSDILRTLVNRAPLELWI